MLLTCSKPQYLPVIFRDDTKVCLSLFDPFKICNCLFSSYILNGNYYVIHGEPDSNYRQGQA